ncbi:N-acetylmuramidase family protein [Variovorax sp. UMC13]|uniref:N-acetylmuramidase family protein n=1 Tax=Variovorax sp. UMC13 TaxID=1862326 RepID=UPI00160116D9|nr:N-acetylmuramidase family protein [Variovorax sp. UMC13]MBB1601901.1 peptidoglycan-binding protein [Variovorax sp. UMC13]
MKTLVPEDFQRAADALGVDVPSIKAVAQIEAPNGGFLSTGEPTILFERHVFSERTQGRFDATHPDISNPTPGGYGRTWEQHARLAEAAALDRTAALEATSWGKFQIMGFNHQTAGFMTLQGFINAMYASEGKQLDAFISFLKNDRGGVMQRALKAKDWATFAKNYNGPSYVKKNYDERLRDAYRALA